MIAFCFVAVRSTEAGVGDRTLRFYNTHTREHATITFKRNGSYDQEGLKQINHILRDWRRNEEVRMDPRLMDLVWEVYQQSGSQAEINIICGYRAPATNQMLRRRSSGVAENSQHMRGNALDFFLPDVDLARLRAIGLRMQIGGVGFYPTSGSPFVHMDTGSVRHWPRMTHDQLVRVFPEGRTLHIPSDGRPLPGYSEAKAAFQARGNQVVALFGEPSREQGSTAIASLFNADRSRAVPAPAARATRQSQPVLAALAVDSGEDKLADAPVPRSAPTAAVPAAEPAVLQLAEADLTDLPPVPRRAPDELVAVRALRVAALARRNSAAAPAEAPVDAEPMQVMAFASPSDSATADPLRMMIDGGPAPAQAPAQAQAPVARQAVPVIRPVSEARDLVPAPTAHRWIDPLARLTFVKAKETALPVLNGDVSTRQAAFAALVAPYTAASPEFFDKPQRALAPGFEPAAQATLRTDRFTGALIQPIAVVELNLSGFRVASR